MILIGYSGHAYVAHGIVTACGKQVTGYCDREEKTENPFNLIYYGQETSTEGLAAIRKAGYFIAIGNNELRKLVFTALEKLNLFPATIVHPTATISPSASVSTEGTMISAGVIINPLAKLGKAVICNTGCIIEHECQIGDFAHIGPGAVLCGNVKVGENSFVGAKSVVREGISIGKNVIIGAGSVVVKDVPDNVKIAGNPARILQKAY